MELLIYLKTEDNLMAKIVICNVCGTTWDVDEECCCPQCGSVSACDEEE